MFLYSAVPVSWSAQCALHTKSLLKVLKSGKACLKVICVYKKMGFPDFFLQHPKDVSMQSGNIPANVFRDFVWK